MKVLLVDDEPYLARLMEEVLQRDGYVVAVAHTLQEAQVALGPFDLVVADVRLPNGDGRHLRACYPTTPFLTMSGEHGELPDLPKPFSMGMFRSAVHQALTGEPHR